MLVASILVPAAFTLAAVYLVPDARGFGTHEQLGLPACGARGWLGGPCPACGWTTALVLLWRGHPLESLAVQPFGFLIGIGVPLLAAAVWRTHWRGDDAWQAATTPRAAWVVRALLVAALAGWIWTLSIPGDTQEGGSSSSSPGPDMSGASSGAISSSISR